MAQLSNPTKGDWATEALEDIEHLELKLDLEDIKSMTKSRFKKIVKEKSQQKALNYLLRKKESRNSDHAKGKHLIYKDMKMADYLYPSDMVISIDEKKWPMKCRLEDIDIGCNFRWKNKNIYCNFCISTEMDQEHLLSCKYLIGKNEIVTYIPDYQDLLLEDIDAQVYTSRIMKENYIRMKHLED